MKGFFLYIGFLLSQAYPGATECEASQQSGPEPDLPDDKAAPKKKSGARSRTVR